MTEIQGPVVKEEKKEPFKMSDLPKQEYAQEGEEDKPIRKVFGIAGENAVIRQFDTNDNEDMSRARQLQDIQQNDFFIPEEVKDEDLRAWLEDKSKEQHFMIWAIAGNKDTHKNDQDEIGEVQGWIYADLIPYKEVREWVEKGIIEKPVPGQRVVQIAYAKLPDAQPGQIASALRVVCASLAQIDSSFYDNKITRETKRRLGINPDESYDDIFAGIDSKQIEFRDKYQKQEDKIARKKPIKPTLKVVAGISPRNTDSIRVAESAGFVRKEGKVRPSRPDLDPDGEYLYELDWDILNKKLEEKALENIKKQLQKLHPEVTSINQIELVPNNPESNN